LDYFPKKNVSNRTVTGIATNANEKGEKKMQKPANEIK